MASPTEPIAPRPPAPRPTARAAGGAASRSARTSCAPRSSSPSARPFRDLTVDEIARAAGLSRSAFYTHFRDKHELLLAAVEEVADELYRMADRWWHGEGPPAERVRARSREWSRVYAEHASLLRVATEVSTYDEEVRSSGSASSSASSTRPPSTSAPSRPGPDPRRRWTRRRPPRPWSG